MSFPGQMKPISINQKWLALGKASNLLDELWLRLCWSGRPSWLVEPKAGKKNQKMSPRPVLAPMMTSLSTHDHETSLSTHDALDWCGFCASCRTQFFHAPAFRGLQDKIIGRRTALAATLMLPPRVQVPNYRLSTQDYA